MTGLVDILPMLETVQVRGTQITVRGLGLDQIGEALAASDDLQRAWAGQKFDGASLLAQMPRAIALIVATAIVEDPAPVAGGNGHAESEAVGFEAVPNRAVRRTLQAEAFRHLNAEDQLTLVEAVIRVSFPGGLSPFVNRLGLLGGIPDLTTRLAALGKAPDTSSPQPSTSS